MAIKAIIFDLDGVITDTAEFHYQSWQQMADEESLDFSREKNEQLRGVSRRRSLEIILDGKELPEKEMQRLMDKKNGYYQEKLKQMTPDDMLPGARELVDETRDRGLKTAIASASRNAKTVIEALKIGHLFDTISDGHSVENPKPAPDLFLHTAEKLNLNPEECAVLEDAEAGIDAALAAGMTAVGIGPEERVGHGHLRFSNTAEVELDRILEEE